MIGIDASSMRLLPMRSISSRAAHVMMKLVIATESDVKVGLEKPRRVKMVAEKYIKEFYTIFLSVLVKLDGKVSLRIHKTVGGLATSKQ